MHVHLLHAFPRLRAINIFSDFQWRFIFILLIINFLSLSLPAQSDAESRSRAHIRGGVRQRGVQVMLLAALVLRPIPSVVVDRIASYAEALCASHGTVDGQPLDLGMTYGVTMTNFLAEGNDGNWGSQAVDLSPAQGAIIEMRFDEDGLYPIVTHAFNFVGKGALGLFQAGDGGAAAEGSH